MARVALGRTVVAAVAAAAAPAGCGGATHSSSSARSATGSSSSTSTASTTSSGGGGAGGGGGGAPTPRRSVTLTVTPRAGGPQTLFRFAFTAPASSGVQGRTALSYALSVAGPARAGCVGVRSAPVAAVVSGHRSTTTLGPGQLGGRWCAGTYAAKVAELVRPVCASGEVCPQFIRLVAILGPVRFTVAR
jgi:hypothetical protein